MLTAIKLSFRLARRLARSRVTARSALPVLVSSVLVVATFVLLQSLALSDAQRVARDLGRFGAYAGFGSVAAPPGDGSLVPRLRAAARSAGADDVMVALVSLEMPVAGRKQHVTLREGDWASRPFPDRYELVSGRWPARANEVAVTNAGSLGVGVGDRLSLVSGRADVQVVGVVDDPYYSTPDLLAGRGTWADLEEDLRRDFVALSATPVVYWDGSHAERLLERMASTLTAGKSKQATSAMQRSLLRSFETREQLVAEGERSPVAGIPTAYTLPSIFLPVLAVLLVFAVNDRRFRRAGRRMIAVGVSPGQASLALAIATTFWLLVAVVGGLVAGTSLGAVAARVLHVARDRVISPLPSVVDPSVRLLGMSLLTCIVCWLALREGLTDRRHRESRTTRVTTRRLRIVRDSRHLLAVAGGCMVVLETVGLDSAAEAMILAGTVCLTLLLVTPEIVASALAVLPQQSPRARLALRQLQGDRRRVQAGVMLLATVVGASLGFVTLLATMIRTADVAAYPDAPRGQIMVVSRATDVAPAPRTTLSALASDEHLRLPAPIRLRYLADFDADFNTRQMVTLPGQSRYLTAVDTVDQAARLLGTNLTPEQASALRAGGALLWADSNFVTQEMPGQTRLVVQGQDRTRHTPPVPVRVVEVPKSRARALSDGLVLMSTVRTLHLPESRGPVVYAPMSDREVMAARHAVRAAGLDPKTLRTYTPPPPPIPPLALQLTAASVVVLLFVVAAALARSQVRALRDYAGTLVALGLSTRWTRQVLLRQQAVIVALGTAVGLVIALPPVIAAAMLIPHFQLSIPWSELALLMVAVGVATTAAAGWSTRRLSAADRLRA
jgi:hypothetical protein